MNILLTGGTGFIGSNLLRRLIPNHTVYLILRKTTNTWRIQDFIDKCNIIFTDISNYELLSRDTADVIRSINSTIHLASYGVSTQKFELNKGVETNIFGTLNLLKLSHSSGVKKFINTGSCFEYAPSTKPYSETSLVGSQSLYGGVKVATTSLVSAYAKTYGYNAFTLRLFTPFGPFETQNRFIPSVILSLLHNRKLSASNPSSVRDYIYIDDVIKAYEKSINVTKDLCGEIINIGSGKQYKLNQIVTMIRNIEKKQINILWKSREESRQMEYENWRCSNIKANNILNWKPVITIEKGLNLTLDWFKEFFSLYR